MKYSSSKRNNKWTWKEWTKFIFEGLVAIGSIGSVLIVYYMTSEQNERTKESLIEINRPYVFTGTPIKYYPFGEIVVHLPIINKGNTPAYELYCYAIIVNDTTIKDPQLFQFDSTRIRILSPNSIDTIKLVKIPFFWINIDTARLYVSGKIWYKDSWNKTYHFTTFVYEWVNLQKSFIRRYEYDHTDDSLK